MHQDQRIAVFQLHLRYESPHPLVRQLDEHFIKFVVAEDVEDFQVRTQF